ncbi:MAG TPA: RNA-guided endonuclease IscB [Ktedonobacterales bacterium]|jgi:5-methylcytosine-specific restriction endonuclease McrA|nr:RNA-guided endonuclease IscB [Ktedonobacterales bacterium]
MSCVFVVDTEHRPLDPIHPGAARRLLTLGMAAVWRRHPFTIILKRAVPDAAAAPQPLRVKIDPGSRVTGLAVVNDATGQVVWAADLHHRGQQVRDALLARRAIRRARRQRHTRYRPVRFANRRRLPGWLPPSLASRLNNVPTWVQRLRQISPIAAVSQELVRFDTQLLEHPDISGVEYRQGELAGYEVREYLLEKWGRCCAYCRATGVPLPVEHIVPKVRGGSDRVSDLALACAACNSAKGTQTAAEFGHPEVQAQARMPLMDAAAVNTTRWALYRRLVATELQVEVGTGGRTKWNRTARGLPKVRWLDAACVGASTAPVLQVADVLPLVISAMGRESRQMCRMDRFGFTRTGAKGARRVLGFQTGDLVRAVVTDAVKRGTYIERVAVRARAPSTSQPPKTLSRGRGSILSSYPPGRWVQV